MAMLRNVGMGQYTSSAAVGLCGGTPGARTKVGILLGLAGRWPSTAAGLAGGPSSNEASSATAACICPCLLLPCDGCACDGAGSYTGRALRVQVRMERWYCRGGPPDGSKGFEGAQTRDEY